MSSTIERMNDQRYTGDILRTPTVIGSISKIGGVKTLVSDPQIYPMSPFKKKEIPTVTIITANIGSPMSLSKKIRSVKNPKIIPTRRVSSTAGTKGIPMA